jgi:hypothetical protein
MPQINSALKDEEEPSKGRAERRRARLRHDSAGVIKYRPSATSARPTYKRGFTLMPVKGSAAGPVNGSSDGAALTGTIAGAAAMGAVPCGPGGGVLVAATTGGTVVVAVVVVDVVGGETVVEVVEGGAAVVGGVLQSSMVCWNPRFATHGGPTYASAWITPQKSLG